MREDKNNTCAYAKENENVKKPIESIIKSNNQIHKTEKKNGSRKCMHVYTNTHYHKQILCHFLHIKRIT